MVITCFELGRQDFARGEPRGFGGDGVWQDRVAGWDAAYRDSFCKAASSLRRVHAGRYESEDGQWSVLETSKGRWEVVRGLAIGCRTQSTIDAFPTFADALAFLRTEATA